MTRRNSLFGSWVRERRRPCKTFTMLAQQLGVSSRGLPNIWEAGCITLAPRLLKSQSPLRRPSGHGVYSRGFGLGGMLPERSDSLFSKPWFCRQCIQVWTPCHRTRVMTNALHSYWLRCPASCCKAVHAQNRGRMYEGITAVGPTRKCSKKWVCSPLPRKGVFGVCSGGKILSEGLKKMLHCWLACLGSFLGRPTRSSVLMAVPRSMQTHGYGSLLKTCACYVALTCQHQASYMINRCCCFPHRTKQFFCPYGSGDFSSRPRPRCQSKRLTAVSSLEIMLVTVVQMQLLRHLSSLVDMLAQTEWHVIMWQAQQLPCRHTDTERMASSSWLDKSLSATSQCPWCRRVFASVEIARRHVHARVAKGACPRTCGGATSYLECLRPPERLECPICLHHASSLDALHQHVVQHVARGQGVMQQYFRPVQPARL